MRLAVKGSVGPLAGQLNIPVSKYHAHRALMLASLAPGTSRIHGLSDAGHVGYTIRALRRLGTGIDDRRRHLLRPGRAVPAAGRATSRSAAPAPPCTS